MGCLLMCCTSADLIYFLMAPLDTVLVTLDEGVDAADTPSTFSSTSSEALVSP